jgi:hypothetical protein
MKETPEDIVALQALLDRSYEGAGEHLLSIHTPNWRVSAERLVELLQGMCVLDLATITAKGEPRIGPVDGFFYRGRWYFGSSPTSMRARHLAKRPQVSAAHTRGEELSVIVHGNAVPMDKTSENALGYRALSEELYGKEAVAEFWEGGAPYWLIEPQKMFALAPHQDA